MNKSVIVTVVGPDKPGLVSQISRLAVDYGANWVDSVMSNIAGQFAGVVHLSVPDEGATALASALRGLAGLNILAVVADGQPQSAAHPMQIRLDLVGHDRPGIVQRISSEIAKAEVSISSIETRVEGAPMAGGDLFKLCATLDIPDEQTAARLRKGLEGIADDLMVDIAFARPGE